MAGHKLNIRRFVVFITALCEIYLLVCATFYDEASCRFVFGSNMQKDFKELNMDVKRFSGVLLWLFDFS